MRFGPYELQRRLGVGGVAETWVALDAEGHRVVVKRFRPELSADAPALSQFLNEAGVLAHLQHRHIGRLLATGVAANTHYLVVEMIDGPDLAKVLAARRTPPPLAVALAIVGQIGLALDSAHRAVDGAESLGIVHREVTPSNVVLSRSTGLAKLVDFGIATWARSRVATTTGFVKGKYAYLAPEQVRQEPLDARADLFSWMVLAYELLTATHPFREASPLLTAQAIVERDPAPLGALRSDAPGVLAELVRHSLAKDPAQRPRSVREALDVLAGLPSASAGDVKTWLGACAILE